MPRLGPCKRREFIRKLKALGYDGPYPGGSHMNMSRTDKAPARYAKTVTVPNTDIDDPSLLSRILRDAKIDRDDFLNA